MNHTRSVKAMVAGAYVGAAGGSKTEVIAAEAAFDEVTKPGDRFQSFKPNAAMQAVLRQDMEKAGFSFNADGSIDITKMPRKA